MITKAALLLSRENNGTKELLFVRSFKKPLFVFPGGKVDEGETAEAHPELFTPMGNEKAFPLFARLQLW